MHHYAECCFPEYIVTLNDIAPLKIEDYAILGTETRGIGLQVYVIRANGILG